MCLLGALIGRERESFGKCQNESSLHTPIILRN